jgi:adenosylhomocysteine nucleosidase
MAIGIVVGLAAEARIARLLGGVVAAGGGTAAGAEVAAEALATGGVTALVSLGFAGGLDPNLGPGDVLVPRAVRAAGQDWATDPSLSAALGGVTVDLLLGENAAVAGAAAKSRLWRTTGAAAVDLESGAVARVAHRHGLPFAVLRAVCDPATRSLPPAALSALNAAGRVRPLRLLAALLRHPGQLPAIVALASDAAHARRALAGRTRAIGVLGPSPVFGDTA